MEEIVDAEVTPINNELEDLQRQVLGLQSHVAELQNQIKGLTTHVDIYTDRWVKSLNENFALEVELRNLKKGA